MTIELNHDEMFKRTDINSEFSAPEYSTENLRIVTPFLPDRSSKVSCHRKHFVKLETRVCRMSNTVGHVLTGNGGD